MSQYDIEITPLNTKLDTSKLHKLDLANDAKSIMSPFVRELPALYSSGVMQNAYILKFPAGLPHQLMQLKQGGVSSTIVNESHKIAGQASLYKISNPALILNTFTIMSIATGQYFLSEINTKLEIVNLKLDKILSFLYGDKKAELISEIRFIQDAYKNFASIFTNDTHRLATLTNIQESKKVAMKNIEFYITDLDLTTKQNTKNPQEFEKICQETLKIKESLDLALQLYFASSVMEVYFSNNFDSLYLENLKSDASIYLEECHRRTLLDIVNMQVRWNEMYINKKGAVQAILQKNKTPDEINPFDKDVEELSNRNLITSNKQMLENLNKPFTKYYLTSDGEIYIPKLNQ